MSGIYIHVPFCRSKCVYCGFFSVANTRQKESYLQALHREIELRKEYLEGSTIKTIYFGGGTPSLLSADELQSILKHLAQNFALENVEEITLEANPEQLTLDYCQAIQSIGINRLSIGVQSFQPHVLSFMGRRHTEQEAINAVMNAHAAGFQNISIDLIYGVSERTDEQWAQDLAMAFSLPIQHLSCYALTAEENSILYKRISSQKHAPIDDEQALRQYQMLIGKLPETKFKHYEISNYAIPGFESKHNSAYWDHTPYIGLGPAAHSFNGNSRQWNASNLNQYISDIGQNIDYDEKEMLSKNDLYNETILLALRTREGLDLNQLRQEYGNQRVTDLLQYFKQQVNSEHYEQKENRLRLTEAGLWFADGIAGNAFILEE